MGVCAYAIEDLKVTRQRQSGGEGESKAKRPGNKKNTTISPFLQFVAFMNTSSRA
jgi:hypothetical protein